MVQSQLTAHALRMECLLFKTACFGASLMLVKQAVSMASQSRAPVPCWLPAARGSAASGTPSQGLLASEVEKAWGEHVWSPCAYGDAASVPPLR